MRIRALLCAVAVAFAVAPSAPAAGSPAPKLEVVSFNVLAPVWAAPVWYPDGLDPALLETRFRRERIAVFLASTAPTTDVYCLQEVQESELPHFLAALGGGFDGFMAHNDRDWWSNWLVPEIPWAPNGTAVIVKRRSLVRGAFRDAPISGDGNHAAFYDGVERGSGRRVRIASVHLDSDSEANRVREARSVVASLPPTAGAADIVCGDLNEDAVNGSAAHVFESAGFADALAAVGNREPTHPWSSSYNNADRWAVIDHVVVRGAKPESGDVLDLGVWSIRDELDRIEANFRNTGSDHFPLRATLGLP
jgi:endonuclease/exonuclease/phosphatase family metal-dependent hydrolase